MSFFTDTVFINVQDIVLIDTFYTWSLKRCSPRKLVLNFRLNVHGALNELFHEPRPCQLSGTGESGDENDNGMTVWLE